MSQPDMNELMQQAAQMQAQLKAAEQEILESTVTGTAGNGLVSIDLGGNGVMRNISIDQQVVDPEDVDTLQDLIMGAFADAHTKLGELAEQKMGPVQQMFDTMPGMF
ncbi:YbaB/EbfC family nucleoid-associated protein [Corynebacterium pelargi]|uniref:Nucleoid-associated protein CPELA_10450 n=1 Tax=Corynebacterium pelargi TaxID=1471400 RepID=A0A410WBM0_9CORY|nr:YbaB/EbfC family nucleoid-associated protein [Corynebacterium pelargi]QAU53339.1 Nucleoid-associated protein [Corynebacterium pelargi]GGG73150.1 nucleoid-associated protein Cgl0243/cg0297 [Corynebacterium pelargi]